MCIGDQVRTEVKSRACRSVAGETRAGGAPKTASPREQPEAKDQTGNVLGNRNRSKGRTSHANGQALPAPSRSPDRLALGLLASLGACFPFPERSGADPGLFLDSKPGGADRLMADRGAAGPQGGSSPLRRRSRSGTGGNAVPPRTVLARLRGRIFWFPSGGPRRDSAFHPPLGGIYQTVPLGDAAMLSAWWRAWQGAGSP